MYIKKEPYTRYSEKLGRVVRVDGRSIKIHWNIYMLETITNLFPTTFNEVLAGILGVSQRTMIRKARELGLEKDKSWLQNVWKEHRRWACIESKRNGYPGSFKKGNEIGKEYRFKKK